jgi:uncharacterized protein (TIGR02594 family)
MAPWMQIAVSELGTAELPGNASNPRIIEYLQSVQAFGGDETAWCSAFANWVMGKAGFSGSGKANARSWLDWGVKLDRPCYGAVTVLWRDDPRSWKGHVAFYVADTSRGIKLLGGNQGDKVSVATYPNLRVLGYRWPTVVR